MMLYKNMLEIMELIKYYETILLKQKKEYNIQYEHLRKEYDEEFENGVLHNIIRKDNYGLCYINSITAQLYKDKNSYVTDKINNDFIIKDLEDRIEHTENLLNKLRYRLHQYEKDLLGD